MKTQEVEVEVVPVRPWKVMAERCHECLFGPNAIVDVNRRRAILAQCRIEERTFLCHKATLAGKRVTCRGFYDQPNAVLPEVCRIAKNFQAVVPGKVVEFVQEADLTTDLKTDLRSSSL